MEVVGTPEIPTEKKKFPRAKGGWLKGSGTPYNPEADVFKDFEIPTEEYVKRFIGKQEYTPQNSTAKESFTPGVDVTLQSPVLFREGGRFHYRWRPLRIQGMPDYIKYLESGTGRAKRSLESSGDPFEFDSGGMGGGSQFFTHTPGPADQLFNNGSIPFIQGPFNKQLYWSDYLLMHSRAFQLVNHAALAAGAVKIMTRFVLGRGVSFSIKNDQAKMIWDEFWEMNHMRHKVRQMARDLCWQGELMLRFYEREAGKLSMRILDPSTCWEVVTDPEDFEHCLDGATKIALLDGTEPTIEELSTRGISKDSPAWTYSWDKQARRFVPGKIVRCWQQPNQKRCVEIEIDSGDRVVMSYDHPVLLRSGEYCQAEKLQPGDSLMPLYRRPGKDGYEEIKQPYAGWVQTHRMVWSEMNDGWNEWPDSVHHKNEIKTDNSPDNLEKLTQSEHMRKHIRENWDNPRWANWRRRKLKEDAQRLEIRQARSEGVTKMWADSIRSARIRAANYEASQRPERNKKISDKKKAFWADADNAIRAGFSMKQSWEKTKEHRVKSIRTSWTPERRAEHSRIITELWAKRKAAVHNHKVISVKPVGDRIVYDLQVEKHHNFALACGLITHNTYYYHFQWPTPYQVWTQGNIPISKYIIQQVPPTNIQHIKINISSQEKRGRSDLLPAFPWLKRFDDYYNGAIMKAILEANLVYKIKIHGDQNDLDSMSSDPNFTIMPPPGGTWLENDAVDMTPLSAMMTAGRGSSGIGQQIASIVATSLNLPTEYFNIEGGAGGARATALVRTDPAVKAVEDRQQILRESLEDLYDRVMEAALREGRIDRAAIRRDAMVVPDDGQVADEQNPDKSLPFGGTSHSPQPVQATPVNRTQSLPGRPVRASIRG